MAGIQEIPTLTKYKTSITTLKVSLRPHISPSHFPLNKTKTVSWRFVCFLQELEHCRKRSLNAQKSKWLEWGGVSNRWGILSNSQLPPHLPCCSQLLTASGLCPRCEGCSSISSFQQGVKSCWSLAMSRNVGWICKLADKITRLRRTL